MKAISTVRIVLFVMTPRIFFLKNSKEAGNVF